MEPVSISFDTKSYMGHSLSRWVCMRLHIIIGKVVWGYVVRMGLLVVVGDRCGRFRAELKDRWWVKCWCREGIVDRQSRQLGGLRTILSQDAGWR